MAKLRVVQPSLTKDEVIVEIKDRGNVNVANLMARSGMTRGVVRGLIRDYAPDKIKLQSRKRLNLIPEPEIAEPIPAPPPIPKTPASIMPRLIGAGCALIALAFGAGNAIMNYRFGASFGQDALSSVILGCLGLAIDGGALLLLPAAGALGEQRRYGLCLMAFLSWFPFVALSTGAAIGFAGSNIGDSLQDRAKVVESREAMKSAINLAQKERLRIMSTDSPEAIEIRIQNERGRLSGNNSLKTSKDCTDITLQISAVVCSTLTQLRLDKVEAENRIRLDDKIHQLAKRLEDVPAIASKDPAAEQISQMSLGLVTPDQVRSYLVRCIAIIPGFASLLLAFARTLLR
jgi:hypothetical protein